MLRLRTPILSMLALAVGMSLAVPTPAEANNRKRAHNTISGAAIGTGVGYIVGGNKGATAGAVVGAIAGYTK